MRDFIHQPQKPIFPLCPAQPPSITNTSDGARASSEPSLCWRELGMHIPGIDSPPSCKGSCWEGRAACAGMFYLCCQSFWLEMEELREPGMKGGWGEGQGGRKTEWLGLVKGFNTFICITAPRSSFGLHVLSPSCEHLWKGQDPYPRFPKGRFRSHESSRARQK